MNEEVRIVERTGTGVTSTWSEHASWGAVFAGMFVTIVLQIMLTLLGTAIGMAIVNPLSQQSPSQELAIGSSVWLLVSGLISVWVGSCIAGRLSGGPLRSDGMIHGVISWSVSTVVMLALLATTTGALIGGLGSLLSGAIRSNTSTEGNESSVAAIQDQIKSIFPQTGSLLPPTGRTEAAQPPGELTALAQQDSQLAAALARLESNSGASRSPQDRDQVINILTSKHDLSQDEAQILLNQWDQQFQQLRTQGEQKVRQIGQKAAHGIGQGALWGFIALFLGLLVAAWGGWAGAASVRESIEVYPVAPVRS
jgi:hypothetical protein